MTQSAAILQTRLEELEKSHGFIEMYYTLRAAERISEFAKAYKGEPEEAGLIEAARRLYEMAEEVKSSPIPPAEIT